MSQTILIIDDEADIRDILSDIFDDEGYNVLKAAHSEEAFAVIDNNQIDLIVLDIWLDNSDMDGVQILKTLKKKSATNDIPILMISGHGNVEMAVNAMKLGAFDFIEKPFKIDYILLTVQRALDQKKLRDENARLKDYGSVGLGSENATAYTSPVMISLMKQISENKNSDARIVIKGEIGTGKTHIAKIIHAQSERSQKPFMAINAYSLDKDDLDSSIHNTKQGTLVLENIEGCPTEVQSHLLARLTSKENAPQCRFISTASNNIDDCLNDKRLSSALYDRLSVITYAMPSLSQRVEDIDSLITHFIKSTCDEFHCNPVGLNNKMIESLKERHWPGNIRQLKIAVEWIVMEDLLNADGSEPKSLPFDNVVSYAHPNNDMTLYTDLPLKEAREQFERDYLEKIMKQFAGNIARIADYIQMERTALYRKLKALDISHHSTTDDKVKKAAS